jgi:hypothetical protein
MTGKTKYVPRMDGTALKIDVCPQCKEVAYIDVHEYFGLKSDGWKMCVRCGHTNHKTKSVRKQ